MKTLTSPIAIPNITKWQLLDDYSPGKGTGTLRVFYGVGQGRWADYPLSLTDVVSSSTGIALNPSPLRLEDTIMTIGSVGPANALSNAGNAYRTTSGTQNARMTAVESQLLTDGIVGSALAGT